uniref:Mon2/Sec7/BIG1-like dimerisation and cyclophilin-binding domain-containing protein n=1 Tax=Fagus sylvatica TaxID=28930 RepID=A0A2N9GHJ3_FAGSY
MTSYETTLKDQLKDAGNNLLNLPSSLDELLNLLDKVETLLANVEQAPSKSMHAAILPSMKALITNELLRHAKMDVKVSIVSCLTEIMRITTPNAPYDDEKMKEIFQLTIAVFEYLSNMSGHCYTKAVSILDTVAKIREKVITNCAAELQPYLQQVVCSIGVTSDTFYPTRTKVGQAMDATFKLVEDTTILDEDVVSFPTSITHIEFVNS